MPTFNAANVGGLDVECLACSHALSKVIDPNLKNKLMEEYKLGFKSLQDICEHHKITTIDGELGTNRTANEVKATPNKGGDMLEM